MIQEAKVKNRTINTILTSISTEAQIDIVDTWGCAAGRTAVFGHIAPSPMDGYRFIKTKSAFPPLRDMLIQYVINLQEGGIIALISPTVLVSKDQSALFNYMDEQGMGRAWAGKGTINGNIRAFIVASSVVPHIMRDLPENVVFGVHNPATGQETWTEWMDNWFKSFLLPHRYFSIDQFDFISYPGKQPAALAGLVNQANEVEASDALASNMQDPSGLVLQESVNKNLAAAKKQDIPSKRGKIGKFFNML